MQNVRGTDGTDDGTDGTCPQDRRDTNQGVSRQNSLCLLVFSFPIVPESPSRTGGVAHKQNETRLRELCMFCTSIVMGMHWTGLPDRSTDHIGETVSKGVSSISLRRGFWAMFREHFWTFFSQKKCQAFLFVGAFGQCFGNILDVFFGHFVHILSFFYFLGRPTSCLLQH